MATTAWVIADGFFDEGDGRRRPAKVELSHEGFAIFAAEGEAIVRWKPVDLVRTMESDGFRVEARQQIGAFVFDPDTGTDLMRALARIPDADAPVTPRKLVWTMALIVVGALAALFALAWGFFWIIEPLFGAGSA